MTGLEIALLIVGIIIFIASFIFASVSDKKGSENNVSAELSNKQKEDIKNQILTVFDEQMDALKEKTEVGLDKISAQKMNEMTEYSNTILSEINRNHSEVMFLYDMLNEKKKEINTTVRDLNVVKKELIAENAKATAAEAVQSAPIPATPHTSAPAADTPVVSTARSVTIPRASESAQGTSGTTLRRPVTKLNTSEDASGQTPEAESKPATPASVKSEKESSARKGSLSGETYSAPESAPADTAESRAASAAVPKKEPEPVYVPLEEADDVIVATVPDTKEKKRKGKAVKPILQIDFENMDKDKNPKTRAARGAKATVDQTAAEGTNADTEYVPEKPKSTRKTAKTAAARAKNTIMNETEREENKPGDSTNMSRNDQILEMSRQGKSNMEIAKTLGMGVGEVKLVVDLFKGGR